MLSQVADAQMMIDQKEDSIARCRHESAIAMAATEQELENTRGEIQGLEEDITVGICTESCHIVEIGCSLMSPHMPVLGARGRKREECLDVLPVTCRSYES